MHLRGLLLVLAAMAALGCTQGPQAPSSQATPPEQRIQSRQISGLFRPGESLYHLFKRHGLSMAELLSLRDAAKGVFNLRRLRAGMPYSLLLDARGALQSFRCEIDADTYLEARRQPQGGFKVRRERYRYQRRISHMAGIIQSNLVESMKDIVLAVELSEIFAWQVDFNTDLRRGDTWRLVVEGLYLDGKFRRWGRILSAELSNNGRIYRAYWYEDPQGRYSGYYDEQGASLRRAFLKAPLSFKRISSGFSRRRFHPILKIYRPHLGVDYAAPKGTPVSAAGDGVVVFAGYKGQNGNLVIIKHPNGYRTYYGHLWKFARGIRKGRRVKQGQVIGYVGSTGLATGPHLDYRVKRNGRFINPLAMKLPPARRLPRRLMSSFKALRLAMDERLASITLPGKQG